jgi:hypothetical protein
LGTETEEEFMSERCTRCESFIWATDGVCRCKPFKVNYTEWFGDEPSTMYGKTAEDVVERLAEKINSDEPKFDTYIFETDVEVTGENGEMKKFNCTAALDVNYSVKVRE